MGDFNVAAEQRDVHSSINFDALYHPDELSVMQQLLADYPDVWRRHHPQQEGVYTVWDEKTSARAFNVVSAKGMCACRGQTCMETYYGGRLLF